MEKPISDTDTDTDIDMAGLSDFIVGAKQQMIDISALFNANADDIFKNEYLSPRSPYTTGRCPAWVSLRWCKGSGARDTHS